MARTINYKIRKARETYLLYLIDKYPEAITVNLRLLSEKAMIEPRMYGQLHRTWLRIRPFIAFERIR